jgi:HPt (histidine-containing phosphotransfer) domain-containing protein
MKFRAVLGADVRFGVPGRKVAAISSAVGTRSTLPAGPQALEPHPGASEVYNRAETLARLGGDAVFFRTLADMFTAGSAGYCLALEQAMAAADAPTLQREAHTLKGLLATFSDDAGAALARRLEDLAKAGDLADAGELTARLVVAVKRLADALG